MQLDRQFAMEWHADQAKPVLDSVCNEEDCNTLFIYTCS